MKFEERFKNDRVILMEGALGERLKHEFGYTFDPILALAPFIYDVNKREAINSLWRQYIDIAQKSNLPFIATTPTRRVNIDSVKNSNFNRNIIKDNVDNLKSLLAPNMYIGGLMGCKGDAYKGNDVLSVKKAFKFHSWTASLFEEAGVDFLFAGIMPAISEAMGISLAMENTGLPYIISFMIRENGRLIDGTSINDAIYNIESITKRKPVCYMANCIHPNVLHRALSQSYNNTDLVKTRFSGIQANTSALPPEELDGSEVLCCSDCYSLASDIDRLRKIINIKIFGGCCGTDDSHIREIAKIIKEE